MQIFYSPDIKGNNYILNEQESRHCIKVLRLKTGDSIFLTNGKGTLFKTVITDPDYKRCTVKIVNEIKNYGKKKYKTHIAIAPTKSIDKFEFFLEKATEIGIDEITPILCEKSERKVLNIERLNKILQSSIKQSLRAYLPILNDIVCFEDFILKTSHQQKFIAHCQKKNLNHLKTLYKPKSDVLVLIGPEGDFTQTEIDLAIKNDYTEISLSPNRLRTETAGIVSCHIINLLNE